MYLALTCFAALHHKVRLYAAENICVEARNAQKHVVPILHKSPGEGLRSSHESNQNLQAPALVQEMLHTSLN